MYSLTFADEHRKQLKKRDIGHPLIRESHAPVTVTMKPFASFMRSFAE
jgi:hypothetical protein